MQVETERNENPSEEIPADEQPKDDGEQEKPADEQPEDESGEESEDEDGSEKDDDLPDWARDKLSKANREAANYRTKLREAEEKLENAKSLEEVDQIISEIKGERESVERELLVENVALKYKLPEKLHRRITGKTRDEMEADAKELAELFGTTDDEEIFLEGGLRPREEAEETDPRKLAKQYGRRQRR